MKFFPESWLNKLIFRYARHQWNVKWRQMVGVVLSFMFSNYTEGILQHERSLLVLLLLAVVGG